METVPADAIAAAKKVLVIANAGAVAVTGEARNPYIWRASFTNAQVALEHDLDAVFALAERVTVMHLRGVLLTGTPDEVRASRAVQEAYLGSSTRGDLFGSNAGSDEGKKVTNLASQGSPESVGGAGS